MNPRDIYNININIFRNININIYTTNIKIFY